MVVQIGGGLGLAVLVGRPVGSPWEVWFYPLLCGLGFITLLAGVLAGIGLYLLWNTNDNDKSI